MYKDIRKANRRIAQLESALKALHTWATFEHGKYLFAKNVTDLCERTLKEKANAPAQ